MNEIKERVYRQVPIFALLCLLCSWVLIVLLFVPFIERWQIDLNTPAASHESIPVWSRAVLGLLRDAVSLPALRRAELAVLYALPFLLIPALLAITMRARATSILLFSTAVNFLFFCTQLVVDLIVGASFEAVSLKGAILLVSYVILLLTLTLQRLPLSKRLAGNQSL